MNLPGLPVSIAGSIGTGQRKFWQNRDSPKMSQITLYLNTASWQGDSPYPDHRLHFEKLERRGGSLRA